MLKLEARPEPSRAMSIASPLIALAITVVIGTCLFLLLGKDPLRGLAVFFVEPVKSVYALTELAVKATPLLLIALGLAVCFRSNVWNIGAEGQFIVGALVRQRHRDAGDADDRRLVLRRRCIAAGVVGGMCWAAIVALLRDRFNANEILVSLMLVYVAEQLLNYLVYGPWKDPAGYNFPQTITFLKSTQVPRSLRGYRVNVGVLDRARRRRRVLDPALSHLRGLPAPGRRPRAGGGALRRLLVAQGALVGAADLGRNGRARRRARGRGAARPADAARARRLRLRRDHRRLRRAPPSGRHRLLGDPDEHVLHRRRARAVAPRPAEVADRRVPGAAAVHAARLRHADRLSPALEAGTRRARGDAERSRRVDDAPLNPVVASTTLPAREGT